MKMYIGTKLINGKSMTRRAYCDLRNWVVPLDENDDDEGYLVEYLDGGKANHASFDGYISWSPKDVFENAYRATDGMSFGLAIEALKMGEKVARAGWDGKGMWLILVPGTPEATVREPYKSATGLDVCEILPHIDMWTTNAHGRRAMLPGWLASQTDMLADDWALVR